MLEIVNHVVNTRLIYFVGGVGVVGVGLVCGSQQLISFIGVFCWVGKKIAGTRL